MIRPFACVFLLSTAVLSPAGFASGGSHVDFTARSLGRAEIEEADSASILDLASVFRVTGAGPSINLSAQSLEVTVHESEFLRSNVSAGPISGGNFAKPHSRTSKALPTLHDAVLGRVEGQLGASLVVFSAEAMLAGQRSTTLGPPVLAPSLRSGAADYVGTWPSADSFAPLALKGTQIPFGAAAGALLLNGSFRLRWADVSLTFSNPEGISVFSSGHFASVGAGAAASYTLRFFEANVTGGSLLIDFSGVDTAKAFGTAFLGEGAARIAMDSLESLSGTAPRRADGLASYWFEGALSLEASSRGMTDSSYSIRINGTVEKFSVGGASLFDLAGGAAVGTGFIAGLLLVFAVWFRETVALVGSRLLIPLYSKLRKDDLLRVPARENLFRAIRESPGIHFLALRKVVAERGTLVAFGALAYHLSQLEKFQLVTSKRAGRYRRYFETSTVGGDAARIALLKTRPVPIVARAVLARPGASQAQLHGALVEELGVSRQALAYHLRRLEEKELVVRELQGRFVRYRPTERLERLACHLDGAPAAATTS